MSAKLRALDDDDDNCFEKATLKLKMFSEDRTSSPEPVYLKTCTFSIAHAVQTSPEGLEEHSPSFLFNINFS